MELHDVTTGAAPTHLRLVGVCDARGVGEIELKFTALVSSRGEDALIELQGVTFLASLALRMLLANAKTLSREGKKMVLVAPRFEIADVLRRAALDKILPIAASLDEALEMLRAE